MSDKIIEIKRAPSFIQGANQEPEVQDYFDMSYKAIGAYFKEAGTTVYASGLTRMEEEALMPDILGGMTADADKHQFRIAVQNYFKNLNVKIPPGAGVKLNISLENDEAVVSDKNMPKRLKDYIIWRWAKQHPQVGATLEEAEKYQHKLFYIEDKLALTAAADKLRQAEDEAQGAYLKIKGDIRKVEMVLTLMGIDTRNLDDQKILLQAKGTVTVDEDTSDTANLERLKRFVEICNDKELTVKYDILDMVRYKVLERLKAKILDPITNEVLGDNLREAVVYFMDKSNSKNVNMYYAKLDSLAKDRRIKHKSPYLDEVTGGTPAAPSTSTTGIVIE
jgi:hypothetical protein